MGTKTAIFRKLFSWENFHRESVVFLYKYDKANWCKTKKFPRIWIKCLKNYGKR